MPQLIGHLLSDLESRVLDLLALILAQVELGSSDLLGLFLQLGDGQQVVIAGQVPEEGAADSHEWPVGEFLLAIVDYLDGALVDHDLVEASLDKATGDVLELLTGLDQQVVALRDLDWDLFSCVASPDVEAGIAGATVDGEKVKIGVEAGEDRVDLAILLEIRGSRGQEMRAVAASILEGVGWEAKANGGHLGEAFHAAAIANVSNILWTSKITKNCKDLRILHGCSPLVHDWSPSLLDMGRIRSDVVGVQAWELSLIWRGLDHSPEESALRVGFVALDIQGAL